MELIDLQRDWAEKTKSIEEQDYMFLDIFPKLCRRAQELICDAWSNRDIHFYNFTWNFPDLATMTPIEQIFCVAFLTYNTTLWLDKKIALFIYSQNEIKNNRITYRVDFLIKNFLIKNAVVNLNKPIIVECDGYDYHSTKEQKNADTERENDLKMLGYPIIRFTGSQIYKNPYLCVMQTIKFLYDENEQQLKEFMG